MSEDSIVPPTARLETEKKTRMTKHDIPAGEISLSNFAVHVRDDALNFD